MRRKRDQHHLRSLHEATRIFTLQILRRHLRSILNFAKRIHRSTLRLLPSATHRRQPLSDATTTTATAASFDSRQLGAEKSALHNQQRNSKRSTCQTAVRSSLKKTSQASPLVNVPMRSFALHPIDKRSVRSRTRERKISSKTPADRPARRSPATLHSESLSLLRNTDPNQTLFKTFNVLKWMLEK